MVIKEIISINQSKHPKSRRYSHEWLLTCLLLHIRSSSTYNLLRNNCILPLPSKSTICRYLKSSNVGCGFDDNFFVLFKKELSNYPQLATNGILAFDEMQVRAAIDVNVKTMTFDGLLDFKSENSVTGNDNQNNNIVDQQADHALVFMYSSLAHTFHQPIGMFACKGATPSSKLASLVTTAIIAVEKAGGKVHALVCDGASTNRGIWPQFGIQSKVNQPVKSSFSNPFDENREIYIISDVPHLIKCIRNNLYDRREFKVRNISTF